MFRISTFGPWLAQAHVTIKVFSSSTGSPRGGTVPVTNKISIAQPNPERLNACHAPSSRREILEMALRTEGFTPEIVTNRRLVVLSSFVLAHIFCQRKLMFTRLLFLRLQSNDCICSGYADLFSRHSRPDIQNQTLQPSGTETPAKRPPLFAHSSAAAAIIFPQQT